MVFGTTGNGIAFGMDMGERYEGSLHCDIGCIDAPEFLYAGSVKRFFSETFGTEYVAENIIMREQP